MSWRFYVFLGPSVPPIFKWSLRPSVAVCPVVVRAFPQADGAWRWLLFSYGSNSFANRTRLVLWAGTGANAERPCKNAP
jgi:hypothetical protein